jgi:flavin reductase (DIM6/NTAB) family NADH-FMN oxidoreductase RutF
MKKSLGPKSLAFPLPAWLIGTYDAEGKPNIMTAAWGGVVASQPPCLGVSVRPSRHTHAAVLKNLEFTISFPGTSLALAVDFAGIVSGDKVDKFKEASLTAVKSDLVNAPYVSECPVVAECRLLKTMELGTHTLFVGEVLDIKADESLEDDGALDIQKVDPLIFSFWGDYYKIGERVGRAFSMGKGLIKK